MTPAALSREIVREVADQFGVPLRLLVGGDISRTVTAARREAIRRLTVERKLGAHLIAPLVGLDRKRVIAIRSDLEARGLL